MIKSIILASKSKVRKKILEENNIKCEIIPSNIDEDSIKESLIKEKAIPEIISKNLAELKANKISEKKPNELVLGADSVIDLNGKLISKPINRDEAFNILQKLNGQKHRLISSVCISKASSLLFGFEIISPFKSITLSAPNTSLLALFSLILFAFNSARFFEIVLGVSFSFNKDSLINSSSIFAGMTSQLILFLFNISFLTPLFDARIILLII